ncbi:MAG: class I SAM-dependent methyltransferase [Microgenomates group bacterium]|jgi:SAM-dependent methyltransferase
MLTNYIPQFLHNKLIHNKRIHILEQKINAIIPKNTQSVLDIGCGDGLISSIIQKKRSTLEIQGLEVFKRNKCLIPCKYFNGKKIPYKNNSFDLCMMVDVLHHTTDINVLLKEAQRVTKRYILIKDHIYSNKFEFYILKVMDWVGNKPYGVKLVYNYQRDKEWKELFKLNKLNILKWQNNLPLYIFPFNLLFGRKMHVLILLEK